MALASTNSAIFAQSVSGRCTAIVVEWCLPPRPSTADAENGKETHERDNEKDGGKSPDWEAGAGAGIGAGVDGVGGGDTGDITGDDGARGEVGGHGDWGWGHDGFVVQNRRGEERRDCGG